jgi:UDP-N-acetylmuramate--alanine ligase
VYLVRVSALFDPADSRPLHFVGIAGAGMSALALAALRRGVPVTGCDRDDSGFDDLRAAGAQVVVGHDPVHVAGARAIVVTAAMPRDHPELEAARGAAVPVVYRKQALAALVNGQQLIAIAGTHGKTTTTVMATEALAAAGLHPSGLAGGRVNAWRGNALLDSEKLFVVEADEYDQAFLTLQPTVAIINNVEPDHLECYGSVDRMEAAFAEFAQRAERVLIGNADAGSDRVTRAIAAPVWRFGLDATDLSITAVQLHADHSEAQITLPDRRRVALRLLVPGLHNLRNATAALGVVVALNADVDAALAALARFSGVGRRFDRLGDAGGVTFVDDYAHHPTELVATLAAARQAFPGRRLVAVFQPHLYSRTLAHAAALGAALGRADVAIVADVYGAREQPIAGVSGQLVADAAGGAHATVIYEPDRAALAAHVSGVLRAGDVLLTLGAGDVTRIGPDVKQQWAA